MSMLMTRTFIPALHIASKTALNYGNNEKECRMMDKRRPLEPNALKRTKT